MKYCFQDSMTTEMLECLISEEDLRAEYNLCKAKYKQATKAADISLPATAANGEPVMHGARLSVGSIADYWQSRGNLVALRLIDCPLIR